MPYGFARMRRRGLRCGPDRALVIGVAIAAVSAAAVAAGCGSSSGAPAVQAPTIGAARTFKLAGFQPAAPVRPGTPTRISFDIQQPSGRPLTAYKRGTGPHTGVHLILVRDDLSQLIHRHPPIGPDGHITQSVVFPSAGRWRVLVDAYPNLPNVQPNFQLFDTITVAGRNRRRPLPKFQPSQVVDGYHVTIHGHPRLRAIEPAFLKISVTDPSGRPVTFTPWYGALAHAIFFRAKSLDYFHTHVCGAGAPNCTSTLGGAKVSGQSTKPGVLDVGVLLPVSGTWRMFLQTRVQGHVLTVPFTLKVR
jgi:hypothetical protein